MPAETRVIDCAWTKPAAHAVKAAGYHAVLGYISHDPSKDLTSAQAKAYVAAGLGAGFVFESTAGRAGQGYAAGVADAKYAIREAKHRGYPKGCALLFAVDFDADPAKVAPYFHGVADTARKVGYRRYLVGPYGSRRVVDYIAAHTACSVFWETIAWSAGVLSKEAHIFQRATKKGKPIAGVSRTSYDEDVICRPVTVFGARLTPGGGKQHHPAHHPKPKPPVPHHQKHKRSPRELLDWIRRTKAKAIAGAVASAVLGYLEAGWQHHTPLTFAGLEQAAAGAIVTFLVVHRTRSQTE